MKIKVSEKNYDKFDTELQYIYNSMVELFEEEDEIVEFSKQAQTFRKQFLDQARALFISMRRDVQVVPVKKKVPPCKVRLDTELDRVFVNGMMTDIVVSKLKYNEHPWMQKPDKRTWKFVIE